MGDKKHRWGFRGVLGAAFILALAFQGLSSGKKLRVITESADIFLQPDTQSMVVETLKKGDILTLSSSRKFRNLFDYVYFHSPGSGCVKSGYVLDTAVERLFQATKSVVLSGGVIRNSTPMPEASVQLLPGKGWGMGTKEAIASLGPPLVQEEAFGEDLLMYRKRFLGLDCVMTYSFHGEKLVRAKFTFKNDFQDLNQHINEYTRIQTSLAQMYGKAADDQIVWHNEELRPSAMQWGRAVSMGHLEYSSRWMAPDSEIRLMLTGKDQVVVLQIICLKQDSSFGGKKVDIDFLSQAPTQR